MSRVTWLFLDTITGCLISYGVVVLLSWPPTLSRPSLSMNAWVQLVKVAFEFFFFFVFYNFFNIFILELQQLQKERLQQFQGKYKLS